MVELRVQVLLVTTACLCWEQCLGILRDVTSSGIWRGTLGMNLLLFVNNLWNWPGNLENIFELIVNLMLGTPSLDCGSTAGRDRHCPHKSTWFPHVEICGRVIRTFSPGSIDPWFESLSYLITLSPPHVHQCRSTGLSKAEWCAAPIYYFNAPIN
jgi:hypothetical protein